MTSTITNVTVYLEGAAITRTMTVDVQAGKQEIRFTGLPAELLPESVAATVSGSVKLLTVTSRAVRTQPPQTNAAITALQVEWQACEDQLIVTRAELSNLEDAYAFLQENRQIGGTQGVRLEDLRTMEAYYRQRLEDLSAQRIRAQKEEKALEKKQDHITQELGEYQRRGSSPSIDIIVELSAGTACPAQITVSYFVTCAGWRPVYEIRVPDTAHDALLIGRAEIQQHTGEDWRDVSLVLSSGQPSIHGEPPALIPWYLYTEPSADDCCMELCESAMPVAACAVGGDDSPAGRAVVRQGATSVEFVLPGPVSVAALQEGQVIEYARHELQATYQYMCVPKLDSGVFLLARIQGWEALDLLEGEASIFLGNAYVGRTRILPDQADDLLELSLGREDGIRISRVKGKDFIGRARMGGYTKASREWLITVRNTRHTAVSIRVMDQIPLSVNKAITVEAVEISGAQHDRETGELSWEQRLEPGACVRMTVRYTVTYPRKERVVLE